MQVAYAHRWNFWDGGLIEPLTPDEARRRDEAGELYTAVLGNPDTPDAIIEVVRADKHIGVFFLDEHGRRQTNYSFTQVDDDRLFLEHITRWQYPHDSDPDADAEADVIEELIYQPQGQVRQRITDDKTKEVRSTDYRDVPLDINWEPVPAFGDWASVARLDRDSTRAQT